MSNTDLNRIALRKRIEETGYASNRDWSNRKPIVSIDNFFAEGVNENAIDNWRIIRFGITAFADLLRRIEKRPDVSAIGIEIDDNFEEGWPQRGYIFVATARDSDEVASWFEPVRPVQILPAGRNGPYVRARVIRMEDMAIAPGHRLWALYWSYGMSYDLMVFEPSAAPREREAFLKWYEQQTEWTEGHSYDDPAVTTPRLAAWYADMRRDFPNMNGPDAYDIGDDEDNPRVTGYTIGETVIYADFRWSEAESALVAALERAVKHGVGFFNVSVSDAEPWFPADDKPDTTVFHNLTLELAGTGTFESPSAALIEAAVDWVTPVGGAEFMILQSASGSYAQAAGGPDEWVAERRDYTGTDFRHWSAEPAGPNGPSSSGKPEKELSGNDVKAIMLSFAYGREKPPELFWEDISARFDKSLPESGELPPASGNPSKPWWQFWR